jgi:serine/threonine protein kinase/TolB-like protein/Tfp pilus assembly protein PilF
MSLEIGSSINQYKIISRLGGGGMGEVYLAEDTRLRRKVALKLLSNNITKNEDWVLRFEQEARAASSLNHPNIITIYEIGQTEESHFISTEFIEGVTLRQYLKQNSATPSEVLDIVIQVSGALVAAHGAGIIHRDIKPENVMLRPDGYVKVVDFGLAKLTEARPPGVSRSDPNAVTEANVNEAINDGVNTNPGMVMGTISYMSPEQATGNDVDARTDVFSLGVVLYEMLSGRLPFEGKNPNEIIGSIIHKKPRPLARFAPDIPPELERIVEKSLSKKRDDRYQSLKDMQIDLRRLKRHLDLKEELVDESEPISENEAATSRVSSQITASGEKLSTKEISVAVHQSSAEYLVSGIRRHMKLLLIAVGLILLVAVGATYYMRTRPIDYVAVLPFTSPEGDGIEQYSDDVLQQTINLFSEMPGLRVVPFASVQQYKGKLVDPQSVGQELGVRAVLSGQIVKRDNSIIVNAWLIDIRDKSQIWGMQRPIKVSEFTLVPKEIVNSVSQKLGIKLNAEEKKRKDAETLYVKGRTAWNKRTANDVNEAINHFNEALKLDSSYAPAHAGLADCYNMLGTYGAKAPNDAFPLARDAANKALALDNNLAEGHAALAYATFRGNWKWADAEREFKQAINLNDNYASTHQWYANLLAAQGRFDEAIAETRRTQELDKTSLIINSHFGLVYYFAHRYDDAIRECQKTVAMDPTFFVAHRYLGLSYAQKGMYKEALAEFELAVNASNRSPLMRAEYTYALALSGDSTRAKAELADLLEISKQRYLSAYHLAAIYVALKDTDGAFHWLNEAIKNRADWLVFLKVDPRFDPLHSEPRFTEILRQVNLQSVNPVKS